MDAPAATDVLAALVPSWSAVVVLASYLAYLAAAGALLPGKLVAGAVLPDSSRLHYRCNGLLSLLLLLGLSALGIYMGWMTPTISFLHLQDEADNLKLLLHNLDLSYCLRWVGGKTIELTRKMINLFKIKGEKKEKAANSNGGPPVKKQSPVRQKKAVKIFPMPRIWIYLPHCATP